MAAAYPFAWRNFFWWLAYGFVALLVQSRLPGIDAFLPGLIIACQEERPQQLFWLLLAAILIQEGTGGFAFGGTLLWYGFLLLLFRLGEFFFATAGFFFVMLLALGMSVLHACLLFTFGALQNMPVPLSRLAETALIQAALIPLLWGPALLTRNKVLRHEHGI